MRNNRCVSGSAVVSRESQWQQRPCQRSGGMHYYSILSPTGSWGRSTLSVAEVEVKREVSANCEEV